MKKLLVFLSMTVFVVILSACQDDIDDTVEAPDVEDSDAEEVETEDDADESTDNTDESTEDEVDAPAYDPQEPTGDEVCATCNMAVYPVDDDMGKFSAQAYTEDEEHFFFDDLFCMINHQVEEDLDHHVQYVRDYVSDGWINAGEAFFVQADIETPMNVGIASFMIESEAEEFAEENEGTILTYDQVAELAHENHEMMMEQGGGHDHGGHNGDHGDHDEDHNEDHDDDH